MKEKMKNVKKSPEERKKFLDEMIKWRRAGAIVGGIWGLISGIWYGFGLFAACVSLPALCRPFEEKIFEFEVFKVFKIIFFPAFVTENILNYLPSIDETLRGLFMFIFVFVLWFFIARSIKASRKIFIGGYVGGVSLLFLIIWLSGWSSGLSLSEILQSFLSVFFHFYIMGALWSAVVVSLLFGAIFGILIASLLCYLLYFLYD
mgnify:CR=1 FL=1